MTSPTMHVLDRSFLTASAFSDSHFSAHGPGINVIHFEVWNRAYFCDYMFFCMQDTYFLVVTIVTFLSTHNLTANDILQWRFFRNMDRLIRLLTVGAFKQPSTQGFCIKASCLRWLLTWPLEIDRTGGWLYWNNGNSIDPTMHLNLRRIIFVWGSYAV